MAYKTATFDGAPGFDRSAFGFGDCRRAVRAIGDSVVMAIGAVATVGALIATVTAAAAWLVGTILVTNPHIYVKTPVGPGALTLAGGEAKLARSADASFEVKWSRATAGTLPPLALAVPQSRPQPVLARATQLTQVAKLEPAPVAAAITPVPPPAPKAPADRANPVPLPPSRPQSILHEIAKAPAEVPVSPAPQVAAVPPPPPAAAPAKPAALREAHNKSVPQPDRDNRTAVYDIAAHTVYLPDGETLEAHSGLGDKLDDPRYINVRMRGPTPPNVYDLTLREELFHGVRAIRLNPVDESKMHGRDGMLAHTYMLGPNGQSNGCVSFKDYRKFLQAFLDGKVNRLVVVPELGNTSWRTARAGRDHSDRYAANVPIFDRNDSIR